jgi:GNAT superfamily N-acetyltransferase
MEPVSTVVRPLVISDADQLAAFYNGLSAATIRTFRPLGDKTSQDVCLRLSNENEARPRTRYDLLAWSGEAIVGWVFLSSLNSAEPQLGVVVADAVQGRGLGNALLVRLLGWARAIGIGRVYLIVVKDNRRAIDLYQRHGFVIYGDEFDEVDQLPYFHMVADLRVGTSGNQGAIMQMRARGTFDVKLSPLPAYDTAIGRLSIDKQFYGDLEAISKGEMLAFQGDVDGSAGYVAIERVTGTLHGRSGTFALQHNGISNRGAQHLDLSVVPDSGTGELAGLAGRMAIITADGRHSYELEYSVAETP